MDPEVHMDIPPNVTQSNDDATNADESDHVVNNKFYSVDAPGFRPATAPGTALAGTLFFNFNDWLNVSFNGTRPGSQSRCSEVYPWHAIIDVDAPSGGGTAWERTDDSALNQIGYGHIDFPEQR
jgi:hypothetical protein